MTQEQKSLLTDEEEAELLKNLLTDPDDNISKRLLEIHYQQQKKILNENL